MDKQILSNFTYGSLVQIQERFDEASGSQFPKHFHIYIWLQAFQAIAEVDRSLRTKILDST